MAKIAKEDEIIEEVKDSEEIDAEIQTTFNSDSLEILVEEGVVENVCD